MELLLPKSTRVSVASLVALHLLASVVGIFSLGSLGSLLVRFLFARSHSTIAKDDPRRVVILQLGLTFNGHKETVASTQSPKELEQLKDKPFVLKEGCQYKKKFAFRVQHEIVSGLNCRTVVKKKGIRVLKEENMIGSFAPQEQPYEMVLPRNEWIDAPHGMIARGKYSLRTEFIDDDKVVHLSFDWSMKIDKDWN